MTPTNHKVFITNFQDMDFSPAEKFGELVFITKGYQYLGDLEKVRNQLSRYVDMSAPTDYLVLNGPSVIIAMLSVLWFVKHGYINMLAWDNATKSYKHFVVGINRVNGNG